ncbi:hypothetical protein DPMN_135432 [Dreissena polymorpha]|uniref:Transposable element P transposase-like GTP-binding insertion domain-containing protein n=1 Tax=Dreissena polymorpha TaxID=45954 RepID=A0A9D4FXN1_DREPO|nr:hypothetical protein DPMN_135432 [Dreissena polymorpha]
MWNNGKDASWLHIVNLYRDHSQDQLCRYCKKLTKEHIDMTSYGCMKVNKVAQVLSKTDASALEMLYGDQVSETVTIIRHMDK